MSFPRRGPRPSAVPGSPPFVQVTPPVTLRFVSFLAPKLLGFYTFLAEQIARSLRRHVEVVVGTSYDELDSADGSLVTLSWASN